MWRTRLTCVVVLLLLCSLAAAQSQWYPTGLYTGNFIAVRQCQTNSGAFYMASTGANVYRTGDSGVTWTDVTAQFGGNTVYSFVSWTQTLQYYTIAGTSAGIYRTNDGGLTWTQASILPTSVSVYELFSPGGGRLLAGTNDGIYFSLTYDQSWTKLTTPVTAAYSFATYMISGQTTVYCGTSDGVWVSAYPSYGASWGELNNASTDAKAVRSLIGGTNLIAAVWDGATGLGVYKSPRSTAWAAANTGLGNLNVNALTVATNMYAATDDGVYESTDAAVSWHDYSTGLPSRVVKCISPVVGGAFCGPQGGGIYKKAPPILTPVLISPANNAVNVTVPTTLTWSYPVGTPSQYDLQYSISASFPAGASTVTVPGLLGTSLTLANLNPLVTYYWRMRAMVDGTWTGYGPAFQFRTADFAAPPSVPTSLTFAPTSPFTTDDITPTASGSVDPNAGDVVSYEYQWCVSNNGGASYGAWGHPERVVTAAETIRGQKWKCRARGTDGVLPGAWYTSAVTTHLPRPDTKLPVAASEV